MSAAPASTASPPQQPEVKAASTLLSGVLLGVVGGVLDVFLYLDHGHVFAGAMTGNMVLFGISLLGHSSMDILHHALPLVGYLCGVFLAEIVQTRIRHHAITAALACETAGLLIASFLPGSFPDHLYVFLIALLAAFQVASFRKAENYSYNSTFITGDLRQVVVGLYQSLTPKARDPKKHTDGLRQFRDLGLIVAGFLGGAVVGALLSPRWHNHTLWLPVAILAAVLAVAVRRTLSGEAERAHRED